MSQHRRSSGQVIAAVLLVGYSITLGIILLNPSPALPADVVDRAQEALASWLGAQDWFGGKRVEFALNSLMFVPVGLLVPMVATRLNWRDVTVIALLASAGVEIYQGLFLIDRSAEFADVVANTLGCAVGAIIVDTVEWLRGSKRTPQT
ncbi:MAG TPA: VanZ family protein [Marmoricola sp.]|nr:VanZ family protein [Nocardioidaceae bacterium]HRV68331.1 VanZ family protein [Marmoricola sp.]